MSTKSVNKIKQPAAKGLDGAPCSPSVSDTPETDAVWNDTDMLSGLEAEQRLADHARRMEREKNSFRLAAMDALTTLETWEFDGLLETPEKAQLELPKYPLENAEVRHGAKDADLD